MQPPIPAGVVPARSASGEEYTNIVFYRSELPDKSEVHAATVMGIAASLRRNGLTVDLNTVFKPAGIGLRLFSTDVSAPDDILEA